MAVPEEGDIVTALTAPLIEELIFVWELQADTDKSDKPGRREALRECADTLRMLVSGGTPVELNTNDMFGQMPGVPQTEAPAEPSVSQKPWQNSKMNPWVSTLTPHQARRVGKSTEEVGELAGVLGRLQIQAMGDIDPSSGKTNFQRFWEESADVEAQTACNRQTFNFPPEYDARVARKIEMMGEWEKHYGATPAPAAQQPAEQSQAARDVLAERARQINAEGWTPEHDDKHTDSSLAVAAACYALAEPWKPTLLVEALWEWAPGWFKPKDPRRNLVKAGALILAEIERLDRASTKDDAS